MVLTSVPATRLWLASGRGVHVLDCVCAACQTSHRAHPLLMRLAGTCSVPACTTAAYHYALHRYLLSSLSRGPRPPPCASAAALRRLLPRAPLTASLPRFTTPAFSPLSAEQKDVGPDRGVSQSSQRSRCCDVPAKVQTEHVHVFATERAPPLPESLRTRIPDLTSTHNRFDSQACYQM